MIIKNIRKITVVDDKGVETTWEGVAGAVRVNSINYAILKMKKQPYQQQVVATLTLPAQDGVQA